MFPHLPVLLLLTGGLLLPSLPLSRAEEYYVTPTQPPNPACPSGKPCYTLNDYAKNASDLFSGKDDVSLLFLDGVHILAGQDLEITNTMSVNMAGVNVSNTADIPVIHIIKYSQISIMNVSILCMGNVSIEGYIDDRTDSSRPSTTSISVKGIQSFTQNQLVTTNASLEILGAVEVHMTNSRYYQAVIIVYHCDLSGRVCFNTSINLRIKSSNINNSMVLMDLTRRNLDILETIYLDAEIEDSNFTGGRDKSFNTLFLQCGLIVYLCTDSYISIKDSYFAKNSTLLVNQEDDLDVTLVLKNVSFINNIHDISMSMFLLGLTNTTIDSCYFEGNMGYPSFFVAYSANILFKGNTTFVDNVGGRGGAMSVFGSLIYFELNTNVTFINNRATDVGGAIYYEGLSSLEYYGLPIGIELGSADKCFYQVTFENNDIIISNHLVYFIKNSAQNGGDNIYGTSLVEECFYSSDYNWLVRSKIFHFDNTSRLSSVSSDPKRVCLCENGEPRCANYSYIVQERQYTSGEKFSLNVALVGGDFGTVSGGVYAILDTLDNSTLGQGQNLQRVENTECKDVEYSLHSRNQNSKELLLLIAHSGSTLNFKAFKTSFFTYLSIAVDSYHTQGFISKSLSITPIFINITILPCPLGFNLGTDVPPTCQCTDKLDISGIDNCTVTNGTGLVYRSGTVWVSHSNYNNDSETDGVLVHEYCPYDYCKVDDMPVDLYHPDIQCAFNHRGILCGGCPSNLSLVLGSSKCLTCTNDGHIALLLFFTIAGFALVFFIKILDLTVARGTINGLIFYANIIWINQSIFFPSGDSNTNPSSLLLMRVLKVFIAWLNLDFGIETCFFQGLDAYWKTWLQFVFPIYVWVIAGMIIVICHYSPKATRLFGNNTVPVLATLFLVSYVKLLRTIVTALGFAILDYPDRARVVWLFDGNVSYFGLRHAFLFVAASIALLALWLPYTATLLLVPCLRTKADHYLLRWVNKWKPFYDAYYGPLKDKRQYWIGATLLVRVVLAVISVAIQAIAPNINVLLVGIVSALLSILATHVYRDHLKALLEASFLVNLIVLSCVFLYVKLEKDSETFYQESRIAIVSASIGISFITFIGIVIFQAYSGIKKLCCNHRAEYDNIDNAPRVQQVTRSVVVINNGLRDSDGFREPLLESDPDTY